MSSEDVRPAHGGVVHTYLGFDPKNFPSPTAPAPDLAGAAFDHMLMHGSMRGFTAEQLANAIRLDPSMFPGLGPSIESLLAMLRERREKILSTYEGESARVAATKAYDSVEVRTPADQEADFRAARARGQVRDLEKLWYRQKREDSAFSRDLLRLIEKLGERYQVQQLLAKYTFTGRTPMTVAEAIAIKEELETIDRLIEQLLEAAKTAQLAIIDLDELSEYADAESMESINKVQEQIESYLREEAKRQGLDSGKRGFSLTPKAFRIFQRKLLNEIFAELESARSGRHRGPVEGEGPVETERTKAYEFGDPVGGVDIVQSIVNSVARGGSSIRMDDLEIHRTRNSPRCATAVLLDMSGSMRFGGQYISCKRMAMALDGLIRTEYPGDFLAFYEMYTLAKRRSPGELPALMPKPVTIQQQVVRLRADMSDASITESKLPLHFTNVQHALSQARRVLSVQDTPNRQIILITDGLPTAHFEGSQLYMLYPPDPRTEEATMREASACAREGITLNIFLLPHWNQSSEDVQFAHAMAERTRGRVFFTGGNDLDRFVLWDYVSQRRKIIG